MRCVELRFNRRRPANFTAYIMWDGRLIEATAVNVSLHGMLLECNGLSCPEGMEISVCCIVSRTYYEMAGRVAHIGNGKIGISFNMQQSGFNRAVEMREEKEAALQRTAISA